MLFNSGLFLLLFFPAVTLLYHALPQPQRWGLLLVASCYFYAVAVPAYLLVLAAIIGIDYVAALFIDAASGRSRRAYLVVSIAANLALLGIFKYSDFAAHNAASLARLIGWNYSPATLGLILPIGLSFHTFQSMAYTIEVYRGRQRPERHLGFFALYVMYYPQLVAGPIERPQHLLPQLHRPPELSARGLSGRLRGLGDPCVVEGLRLILVGLFKKLVVADRLALVVDSVYGSPAAHGGVALIVATACFAVQIYGDFSGYTDIARGTALTMGVRLTHNFHHPYGAASVGEFWHRWHMSLSTWFRDYVYIPLGGSRGTPAQWARNILVTFVLSGLWHGASWTFVVWGALHGAFLLAGRWLAPARLRITEHVGLSRVPWLHRSLQVTSTLVLVSFAWIFFRAESLPDAWYIATHLTSGLATALQSVASGHDTGVMVRLGLAALPLSKAEWLITAGLLVMMLGADQRPAGAQVVTSLQSRPAWLQWSGYYALACAVLFFGVFRTATFIYFRF